MKSKAYFQYYETFENILEKIKDDTAREHFRRVIIRYGLYGTEPHGLTDIEEMAWTICKDLIDAQQHRREVNRANATGKRTKAEPKPTAPRFVKPTVEDVAAYCKEKGYAINAEHFINYYEANGWKVGKNPMKSWQATCANWASRERKDGTVWNAEQTPAEYNNMFN